MNVKRRGPLLDHLDEIEKQCATGEIILKKYLAFLVMIAIIC